MKKVFKILFKVLISLSLLMIFLYIIIGLIKGVEKKEKEEASEIRGIFLSYLDYSADFKNKDENALRSAIETKIKAIKDMNLNTVFFQVRTFADAIYPSELFPASKTVTDDYLKADILKIFLEIAHKNNIQVHAWINPYRISYNTSEDEIKDEAIYKSWLGTNKIQISDDGIYFNPASEDVLNLILDGIKELIKNYDIDGILYDDYFYPNKTIDLENYSDYIALGGTLAIEDYRRENITKLIKESYQTVKSQNNEVLFGISPAGNISNNKNTEYLDIEAILSGEKCLDYVMPQLYFGLNNGVLPYEEILNTWNALIKDDTALYVALALYKSGEEDRYAKDGKDEWKENTDIIKKEIILARNVSNYEGFGIFRYDFLFSKDKENEQLLKERENIKELLTT